ncbi:hypothetical protein ACT4EA_004171 [Escherichia coli]
MRNPNDGITLAAIVAKETTTGEWSGTGSGIGFGTGGMGFLVGDMSGTSRDQTQRAKEFEGPQETSYSLLNVYGPMIVLIAVGMGAGFAAKVVSSLDDVSPSSSSGIEGPLGDLPSLLGLLVDFIGTAVPVLAFLAAIGWFVFCSYGRHKEESERVEREEAKTKARKKVYNRLRYVENDHIVFDPESLEEVPAEREAIAALITRLANKSSKKPA